MKTQDLQDPPCRNDTPLSTQVKTLGHQSCTKVLSFKETSILSEKSTILSDFSQEEADCVVVAQSEGVPL